MEIYGKSIGNGPFMDDLSDDLPLQNGDVPLLCAFSQHLRLFSSWLQHATAHDGGRTHDSGALFVAGGVFSAGLMIRGLP